jgi:competence protein ComEA
MFSSRGWREQIALYALGGLAIFGIGYVGAARMRQPAPLTLQTVPYRKAATPPGTPKADRRHSEVPEAVPAADVVVDVKGAVARPGVQHLRPGARVEDAIRAAGGVTKAADLDRVDLAAHVSDGEMVRVPRHGDMAAPPPLAGQLGGVPVEPAAKTSRGKKGKAPVEPVNLNTATAEELESLPGVGPSTAQRILDYRASHGAFASVEELSAIHGLGKSKLEKLKPYVRL